jgi:hypothetical protein
MVGRGQFAAGEQSFHLLEQLAGTERFANQAANAVFLPDFRLRKLKTFAAKHDHRQVAGGRIILDSRRQAQPAQPRHLAIGDDDVGQLPLNGLPALFAIAGENDVIAGPFEFELGGAKDMDFIVAKQDAFAHDLSRSST